MITLSLVLQEARANMGTSESREVKMKNRSVNKTVTVDEINRRSLGKFILKCVGNEGSENSKEEQFLRRQMQTCISELENYKEEMWRNAIVTFIGMDGLEYDIVAGTGKHRFMTYLDGKDEIRFKKLL